MSGPQELFLKRIIITQIARASFSADYQQVSCSKMHLELTILGAPASILTVSADLFRIFRRLIKLAVPVLITQSLLQY